VCFGKVVRPGTKLKADIKMDVRKVDCEDESWIELAEDRVRISCLVL
jgi:hypothetical protein